METSKRIIVAMLFAACLVSTGLYAQDGEDTAFIRNYKRFRQFVDPLGDYDIYLVINRNGNKPDKISLNELEGDMKQAYHFLRRKTAVKKNATFNVAAVVTSVQSDAPYTKQSGISGYQSIQTYYVSLNLLVYANGRMIEFPLCRDRKFEKIATFNGPMNADQRPKPDRLVTKNVNGVSVVVNETPPTNTTPFNYAAASDAAQKKLSLTDADLKNVFTQVLRSYKNYYIDRVDN